MNPTIDTISFANPQQEGLDYDTAEILIPKGHSRYRLNCRSGASGGSIGRVQSVKGTTYTEIELDTLDTHTTIGWCEDSVNNHIYYFVAGLVSDHMILRFDAKDSSIDIICRTSALAFNQKEPIHNPKYVDGVLLWVNRKPQSLIVENAINNHNGVPAGLTSYADITTQVLDSILHPPGFPPQVEYFDDTTRTINNLRGNMWQFTYQYVYVDNGQSCWSPASKVAKPLFDENVDGRYFEDQTINNGIAVTVQTGTNEVKRINIAVRDSNISEWVLIESIDKYDASGAVVVAHNTDYVYEFFNDYRGDALSQGDVDRPFDFIPIETQAQEVIDDEILVYANNTEGYDNTELDAELRLHNVQLFAPANIVNLSVLFSHTMPDEIGYTNPINYQIRGIFPALAPNEVANYKIRIERRSSGIISSVPAGSPSTFSYPFYGTTPSATTTVIEVNYLTKLNETLSDIIQGIADAVNDVANSGNNYCVTDIPNSSIKFHIATILTFSNNGVNDDYWIVPVYNITIQKYPLPLIPKTPLWKQGSFHQFGVVYYDRANRSGFTNDTKITNQQLELISRVYFPTTDQVNLTGNGYKYTYPTLRLRHRPPQWATHYQVVAAGSQSIANSIVMAVRIPSELYLNPNANDDTVRVKVNEAILRNIERIKNISYGTYAFSKGDRFRILYVRTSYNATVTKYLSEHIDVEVIGYDDVEGEIILPNFNPDNYNLTGTNVTDVEVVVEIYTPSKKKEDTTIFREIGECYEIGNAGLTTRYHKGNTQDQNPNNLSFPAIVNLQDTGDSYIVTRCGYSPSQDIYAYLCESLHYSDYYISDSYDFGRANRINKDAKQRDYINYYRHGGRKFPMTNLNYMFKFDYDDFDSVNIDKGEIVGIRQIGYTLKILQQKKITSQYIGRTELLDNRGQSSLQKSDKIFGSKNPSDDDYGCADAGSILVNDRHLYFFDVDNGCYIRDAANGMQPISKYGMDTFWKEVSKILSKNKGNYDINTVFNNQYSELYVTVKRKQRVVWVGEAINEFTIHYHEDSNRWKSFWSFIPECYGAVNNTMVSFVDSHLHQHETNDTHTNFYGVQHKLILDVFSNENPKQNKLYRSIGVHSNLPFYCPDRGDILIYPNSSYPNGMESRLTKNRFDVQEGIWYAGFMNDMSDPRFVTELEALFGGRALRGRVMKVKLTADGDEATELDFVTINSMVSEISI